MVCCLWSSGRGRRMLCKLLVESSARSRMYVYELGRMSLRPQICWYTRMSGRMYRREGAAVEALSVWYERRFCFYEWVKIQNGDV